MPASEDSYHIPPLFPKLGFYAAAFAPVFVVLALLAFSFDFHWVAIRWAALRVGRPVTVTITSAYHTTGRHPADYATLNYQYAAGNAPRVSVPVTRAFRLFLEGDKNPHVEPAHVLAGCPSCVALDDDRGWADQQLTFTLYAFLFIGAVAAVRSLFPGRAR